jgi:hypothetical protein
LAQPRQRTTTSNNIRHLLHKAKVASLNSLSTSGTLQDLDYSQNFTIIQDWHSDDQSVSLSHSGIEHDFMFCDYHFSSKPWRIGAANARD